MYLVVLLCDLTIVHCTAAQIVKQKQLFKTGKVILALELSELRVEIVKINLTSYEIKDIFNLICKTLVLK